MSVYNITLCIKQLNDLFVYMRVQFNNLNKIYMFICMLVLCNLLPTNAVRVNLCLKI